MRMIPTMAAGFRSEERRVGESAVGESDDTNDDEYDTDNTDRFHRCEVTMDAGLESD